MSDGRKLWVVTIATEIVVLAADQRDAMAEAREALRDIDPEPEWPVPMTYLPGGWDHGCIPYGADGDATIEDLIASGAAPEYVAAKERSGRSEYEPHR